MSNEVKKVIVGMSGGVDSSVTASLLKKEGFSVFGVHIKMWSDPAIPCMSKEDRYDAIRAAAHLGIPFETWDLTEEYKKAVVEYMIAEYAAGRTPNPDVMCNREIKFGVFLARALAVGADFVATGHYVRLEHNRDSGRFQLREAKDSSKDQSYFLWTLGQEQLRHSLFPVGGYLKSDVRQLARDFGLPNAAKPDSQGICFIGQIDIKEFLRQYIPDRPGLVCTTSGKEVGGHDGLSFYTIGQRNGIGIGGGIPYYVAAKDFERNALVVAEGPYDAALFSETIKISNASWIAGERPNLPMRCQARIRYRQPLQACLIEETGCDCLSVRFDDPQRAVTPGQSAVFYRNGEMFGGGIIV